jgi:alpha-amylase
MSGWFWRAGLACIFLITVETANAGVIFDAHKWKYPDLMSHMPAIRDAGFTAVLISPHQKGCGGGYSEGYDPYDYRDFNSRFGSESDLFWLVGTAHWFGLQIYADMVMNHMCPGKYDYPRFSWNDFHHIGGIQNWNDPYWLENGDLIGLSDLNHESGYVRGELFDFLVKTNNIGFDGYRWDAAKHIPAWFFRDHIVNNVNAWGKYSYGEVWSSDPAVIGPYVNAGMSVTDFGLYDAMKDAFRYDGNLAQLANAGYAAQNGYRALTFVENHDTGPPQNRYLALAFIAAYPGYPAFYNSSPYDPAVKNLVWIQNHLAHGAHQNRIAEKDVLVFAREGHLIAGFNQSPYWISRWVYAGWTHTRLNDYSGHADKRWTNQHGWFEVSIPPMTYVMYAPG